MIVDYHGQKIDLGKATTFFCWKMAIQACYRNRKDYFPIIGWIFKIPAIKRNIKYWLDSINEIYSVAKDASDTLGGGKIHFEFVDKF